MHRKAMWAGPRKFYSDDPDVLLKYLKKVVDTTGIKTDVKAVMLPHAGYFYSGAVAGKTISCVNVPDTIIILGPNHTGLGQPYSIVAKGQWSTPLGPVNVCAELASLMLQNSNLIIEDESPHINEHAIEVELPFLKYMNNNISIVPMIVSDFLVEHFEKVGNSLAQTIEQYKKSVLIVVSSDLTHYESEQQVKLKDQRVIEAILALDPKEMINRVNTEHISMCGYAPMATALFACKKLKAKTARLIDYKTSGDVTEDTSNVVGYAGIIIK